MNAIGRAQKRGLKLYGETCPQYLFLTADDLDRDGMDGAMCCCSPPPRDKESQEAVWEGLADGTFQVFSSDHAPYRFDETGKLAAGPNATFEQIANGVPGLEVRMPLLFSEGVGGGRIDIHRFVDLTATRAAVLYGIYPRKGTIAVGSDADIAIWDPEREFTITAEAMHDNVGYTPYEGRTVKGFPTTVIRPGTGRRRRRQAARRTGEWRVHSMRPTGGRPTCRPPVRCPGVGPALRGTRCFLMPSP